VLNKRDVIERIAVDDNDVNRINEAVESAAFGCRAAAAVPVVITRIPPESEP
jgi:hypothetical protein